MRNEARGRSFAVDAGHRHHWDAAIVAGLIEQFHDRATDVATLAKRRVQVHPQTRCSIDFDDAAVLVFEWSLNAFAHDIHATDMQANHIGCINHARGYFGMDVVGHVGRGAASAEIGVVA